MAYRGGYSAGGLTARPGMGGVGGGGASGEVQLNMGNDFDIDDEAGGGEQRPRASPFRGLVCNRHRHTAVLECDLSRVIYSARTTNCSLAPRVQL
jgi:hypothetical protein